uniref:Uncharacterized protein n=2 Tax=Culex quinquefasciatus TaxID=7176 RepID=A0A1S4KH03_CULQU
MEFKYASWIVLSVGVSINIFGLFWFLAFVIGLVAFLVGLLTILYLQHGDLDKFLDSGLLENPLDEPKTLGLSIVQTESTRKSKGHGSSGSSSDHGRRRNLLDAGMDLLFKNRRSGESSSSSGPLDAGTGSSGSGFGGGGGGGGSITDHLMHKGHLHFHPRDHTILDSMPTTASKQPSPTGGAAAGEERSGSSRWGPFHNIKIHTDKGKSIQLQQQSKDQVAQERQNRKK